MARTQMWDLARAVVDAGPCPKCGEPTGERCRNLRANPYRNSQTWIGQPHKARYPAGNRNISDPLNHKLLEDL